MFKKIAMMMLLGGLGMMMLAGCSGKSSRQFIEGKAAELSKVYPTENLEILKLDRFQVQYQRNKLVLIKMRSVVKGLYIRVKSFIKMVKFN